MQDLHLVGFTTDRRGLIVSTRAGARSGSYVLPVTDELLALLGDLADDPGALVDGVENDVEEPSEPVMAAATPPREESQLPVREIQARLRSGETVERVARRAGVSPEWVERFAAPVRAEQRRVVDRALDSRVERARAGVSAMPLRDAVAIAMAEKGLAFTALAFDRAWASRMVGADRWLVDFHYHHRGRDRVVTWHFDPDAGVLEPQDRVASQIGFVADDEVPRKGSAGLNGDAVIGAPGVTPLAAEDETPPPTKATAGSTRSSRPSPSKTGTKKSGTKKAAPRRKAATKTPATKKSAPRKKAGTKKSATKKAAPRKKSATKKAAPRTKAAPKKQAGTKKSGTRKKATPRKSATKSRPATKKTARKKKPATSKKSATSEKSATPRSAATQTATSETTRTTATTTRSTTQTAARPRTTERREPAGSPRPEAEPTRPVASAITDPAPVEDVIEDLATPVEPVESSGAGATTTDTAGPEPDATVEPADASDLEPEPEPAVEPDPVTEPASADMPARDADGRLRVRARRSEGATADRDDERRARAAQRTSTVQFRSGAADRASSGVNGTAAPDQRPSDAARQRPRRDRQLRAR